MDDFPRGSAARPVVRVLESFPDPRPTTNPYIVQLAEALRDQDGVALTTFTWGRALGGRYDVFHAHWPEILMEGRTPGRRLVRRVLTAALCLRLLVTSTPVVRTWHNVERPSPLSWWDDRLLDALDRLTALRIRLNDVTTMPSDTPFVTILHGDYTGFYAARTRSEPVVGRLAYVGLIRRYKGVEHLIEAFTALSVDDAELSLEVAGRPSSTNLEEVITGLAEGHPRIRLRLGFLHDAEFVEVVTSSQLVVLPYRHMHNSGSVLAALSLGRPVLVPDNEVNRRLGAEVGPGWVITYPGEELTVDGLRAGVEAARQVPASSPDLTRRHWQDAGAQHVAAFRQALESRRRRPRTGA